MRLDLWTMMAELCFSVDDLIVFFFRSFSNTAADTASEYDSCGHRRCWTAAASCPYCYFRRRAKPVGIVLPRVCCSRTRCCALWFVDDNGRALFLVDDFSLFVFFVCFQQYSSRHRKRIRQLRAPSLLESSAFVALLLLPAPRQAGRACSALCVLFSYSLLCALVCGQ